MLGSNWVPGAQGISTQPKPVTYCSNLFGLLNIILVSHGPSWWNVGGHTSLHLESSTQPRYGTYLEPSAQQVAVAFPKLQAQWTRQLSVLLYAYDLILKFRHFSEKGKQIQFQEGNDT